MTETIQQFINSGDAMFAHCSDCDHYKQIDMAKLQERLGPDHGALYPALKDKLKCAECGSKNFSFVRQAKGNEKRNSYAVAKGL